LSLPDPPVLVITDRHQSRLPLPALAAAVFAGGGRWLLLRDKDLAQAERIALARLVIDIAAPFGATVLMSGDVEAAIEAGAAGVHLPRDGDPGAARARLGPAAWIGMSAHDLGEAERAAAAGADYATLSPIFASPSKPAYGPALGLEVLSAAAAAVGLPVLALGGVTAARARDCLEAGAAGIAVMGEVMRAGDPAAAVRAFVPACRSDIG
jgi:thiamine-phosphate pyrophosphorylase